MYKDNDSITERIIHCAYQVSNKLGSGFLEKVYENALVIELKKNGFQVQQQFSIEVYYEGECVGNYFADILVNEQIIVELKCVKSVEDIRVAQLLNYLKATEMKIGLILNFWNPKVEVRRLVNSI